jgi:hypothetical protein
MRMKVICGDEDCREEFYVESKEHIWICPNCSREIENRNYPFLTARLMQAKIEKDEADWKKRLEELIEEVVVEVTGRSPETEIPFLNEYRNKLHIEMSNQNFKELHDELLKRARNLVLEIEK